MRIFLLENSDNLGIQKVSILLAYRRRNHFVHNPTLTLSNDCKSNFLVDFTLILQWIPRRLSWIPGEKLRSSHEQRDVTDLNGTFARGIWQHVVKSVKWTKPLPALSSFPFPSTAPRPDSFTTAICKMRKPLWIADCFTCTFAFLVGTSKTRAITFPVAPV